MNFNTSRFNSGFAGKIGLTVLGVAALIVPFVLKAQTSANVTTTVHDVALDGVTPLNTMSDLYQGGSSHSATYNTITCTGKGKCTTSMSSTVGTNWSLLLYTQSIRKIVLNLNSVASGPPVFNPPLNAAISEKVEIYIRCYDLNTGVQQSISSMTTGQVFNTCTFGEDFLYNNVSYKLTMGTHQASGVADVPGTGFAMVTCNASTSATCTGWTITNAGTNTAAALYGPGQGRNPYGYTGTMYNDTFRIDVTNP
jgi:hypothetical protein